MTWRSRLIVVCFVAVWALGVLGLAERLFTP